MVDWFESGRPMPFGGGVPIVIAAQVRHDLLAFGAGVVRGGRGTEAGASVAGGFQLLKPLGRILSCFVNAIGQEHDRPGIVPEWLGSWAIRTR